MRVDNRALVNKWHSEIIRLCESKLGRKLTGAESKFITSRGGFVALEIIEDTVKSIHGKELEAYLNSENG
jgi:hypothetical protein